MLMFAQSQIINSTRYLDSRALQSSVRFIFARIKRAIAAQNVCQAHAQLARLNRELREMDYYALEMSLVKLLLRQIMTLDNVEQEVAGKIIQFALDCGLDLMQKYGHDGVLTYSSFPELSLSLARLPIHWQHNALFLKTLLRLFQQEYAELKQEGCLSNIFTMQPMIIAFSHFLALPIDGLIDKDFKINFVEKMLNNFVYYFEYDCDMFNFEFLSAVWKTYVKFNWQKQEHQQLAFTSIENTLRRFHEDDDNGLTESIMQKDVVTAFNRILNRASRLDMQEEYSIGPYRCDIVFPELKLAIEVNGPCHYRGTHLRRSDQFRNHLIHRRTGFKVFSLPYQEIDACHKDNSSLEQYLKNKLSAHSELFEPAQRKYRPPHLRQQQFYAPAVPSMQNKPGVYVPPALRGNRVNAGSSNTNSRTRLSW